MADLVINDVVKEINTYLSHNPDLVSSTLNREASTLDKHTKPITKVKGKYPSGNTILTNVVQGFSDEWSALGEMRINHKILTNYHQKVNFEFKPSNILNSYWAHLYAENLKREDMPISKYIIEKELLPKVIDDICYLEVKGEYDANNLDVFGNSMNGIEKILADMAAQVPTEFKDRSAFLIPLDTLTDSNMVEQVTSYERQIPSKLKGKIKKLFMSENNVERYILDYENSFGQNKFQNNVLKSRLGKREIVAIPNMDSDHIFATTESNFVRLIDVFDGKPAITDVQKQDYKVKIFMEFWKGYDMWIDEMVLISNYSDATYGLGLTAKNQTLYAIAGVSPNESVS